MGESVWIPEIRTVAATCQRKAWMKGRGRIARMGLEDIVKVKGQARYRKAHLWRSLRCGMYAPSSLKRKNMGSPLRVRICIPPAHFASFSPSRTASPLSTS